MIILSADPVSSPFGGRLVGFRHSESAAAPIGYSDPRLNCRLHCLILSESGESTGKCKELVY